MSKMSERVVYFDYLKIMATFAVVLLHVAAEKWGTVEPTSYEWQVLNVYDSVVRWAVPIFVMVSGALFLDPRKKLDVRKLYTKNIFHMITVFIFWSLFYALVAWKSGRELKEVVLSVIKGNNHMWFLFMIVGLYILVPVLRVITESKRITEYFLLIALVFALLIPRGLQFLSILNIPHTVDVISTMQTAYSRVHFHFAVGFVSYFVAGYYFAKCKISKKVEILIYCLGLIGFVATIYLTLWYSTKHGQPSAIFYDEFSITVMLETLAVFVFAKCRLSKIKISYRVEKMVGKVARYGLGVYLVHIAVLSYLRVEMQIHALAEDPIYMVPILTLVVWLLSLIISFVLNHIPVVKKYIV